MKRIVNLILAALFILSFAGCQKQGPDVPDTTAAEEVKPSLGAEELQKYFSSFTEGDDPLYGTWQLENFSYISFIFRNDKLAEMVMGTEGDFSALEIDGKKKTLSVQFVLGLNGKYSYELSKDKKTLTLTLDGKSTKLLRQPDYNLIPEAPVKPEIDYNIVGIWVNEDGVKYFFGSDGIMYSNQISIETVYTYSAKNGVITAEYDYGEKIKSEKNYSVENGKLILDGETFEKTETL